MGKPIRQPFDTLVVRVPMTFRKRGGRRMVILPDGVEADLPLVCHPVAIRASACFAPSGAGVATGDLRSWSGLRS